MKIRQNSVDIDKENSTQISKQNLERITIVTLSKEKLREDVVELKNWRTGLLNCSNIYKSSGFLCKANLKHQAYSKKGGYCCGCVIGDLVSLRKTIRHQNHIKGSSLNDFFVIICCPICAVSQMQSEVVATQQPVSIENLRF